MSEIGILLTDGPFQTEKWETAYNIGLAALEKGHKAKYFLYLDGVYNPIKTQDFPGWEVMPRDRFKELVDKICSQG